ncbi:hypothetical protein ACJMK2_018849 [Sinanodonta woodiana]|uniref:Uncharacterized protein n=1 Tax=Sinanodonta woodiana TaxID=1069815 RepID=A0ABD3UI21_SINWO
MAFFNKKDIEFKMIGCNVRVADDPRAKLMYYLHCMCTVVDLSNTSPNLQLIILCVLLDPDEFIDKCIFQNDVMCLNSSNKFYEITQVNNHLLVAGNVIIGGRNRRVNKIMAFKRNWIQDNYYTPLNILLQQRQMRRQNNATASTIS